MRGLFEVLHRAGFESFSQKKAMVALIRLGNCYTETKFLTSDDFSNMENMQDFKEGKRSEASAEEQAYAKEKLQQALRLVEQNYQKIPIIELASVLYQCRNESAEQYDAKQVSQADFDELLQKSMSLLFKRFDMISDELERADEIKNIQSEPMSWKEAAFYTAAGLGVGYLLFKASEDLRQCPLDEGIAPSFLI